MSNIERNLMEHLKKFDSAPFLFIGSGFSRRYLELEDWEGLLNKFCELLPKEFEYYTSIGEKNWAKVAGLMAEDFFEIWWREDQFKESRIEFKGQIINKFSPLKIEISKYLREQSYIYGKNAKHDREIEYLKSVVIDGIITTNWDNSLEELFKDQIQTTYIGQEELLFSNPKEIAEIYKIHGSSTRPNTLVLTDKDYKEFKERNAYLAAKLMTIFIEHPIIFIGYSLSDENIIDILRAITSCLTEENLHKLKDRLIFVQRDTNSEGDSFQSSPIVIRDTTLNVTCIRTNDYEKIYKSLSVTKRKIPAKILRQMKSQIYELVKTNDPNGQIYAAVDLEEDYDPSEIEFVYGVGISDKLGLIGYKSLSSDELFKGIVLDSKKYNFTQIVQETLPEALRHDRWIPVFKYVSLSGLNKEQLDPRVVTNLDIDHSDLLNVDQKRCLADIADTFNSIKELEDNYSDEIQKIIYFIPLLKIENIDLNYLKEFITINLDLLKIKTYGIRSNFRKLIRFYDWLVYKNFIENNIPMDVK